MSCLFKASCVLVFVIILQYLTIYLLAATYYLHFPGESGLAVSTSAFSFLLVLEENL